MGGQDAPGAAHATPTAYTHFVRAVQRGRDAIAECAREYEQRRHRDAREASRAPFIAASLTRANEWLTRNLARLREVIGTTADLPAWTELDPWAREGLRRYFEVVERVETSLIERARLSAERDALLLDNVRIKEWLNATDVTAPPTPTTPKRATGALESLAAISDPLPSNRDARALWTSAPPMALMRTMLDAGHVALRRQRDHHPLSASVAAPLVAPMRKYLPNQNGAEYSDDDLLGVALLSATRVQQRAPLVGNRPAEAHYVAFIAEVEQTHPELEAADLADLWAVSVLPFVPPAEVLKLKRSDLRRAWARRLRQYRSSWPRDRAAPDEV